MNNGKELGDAFIKWLEKYPPCDRRDHREDEDYRKRQPLVRGKNEVYAYHTESYDRAFDMVICKQNTEDGHFHSIYPIEFKSDNDTIDERMAQQIKTHLHVLGKSIVVLDSKIGYELLYNKKFVKFIPSIIFVRKGDDFIRLSDAHIGDDGLPQFYANNLKDLLPKGFKLYAPRLLTHFDNLDSIMRKLYVVRLFSSAFESFPECQLSDEEVDTLMTLLVNVSAREGEEVFTKLTKVFKKVADKIDVSIPQKLEVKDDNKKII